LGPGEGSIHKLPNGRWRAQYYVETPKAASDVRSDQIQRMRDGSGLIKWASQSADASPAPLAKP
jgi:hypothetical protein